MKTHNRLENIWRRRLRVVKVKESEIQASRKTRRERDTREGATHVSRVLWVWCDSCIWSALLFLPKGWRDIFTAKYLLSIFWRFIVCSSPIFGESASEFVVTFCPFPSTAVRPPQSAWNKLQPPLFSWFHPVKKCVWLISTKSFHTRTVKMLYVMEAICDL